MTAFTDIERCRREIAAIEAELLAGNPDVEEQRREKPPGLNPAAGGKQLSSGQALIE